MNSPSAKPRKRLPVLVLAACAIVGVASVSAQNIFTDADGGDSDWSTAGNWSAGEPVGGEDAFVFEGRTVNITMAGEAVQILFLGDARDTATGGNDGTANMTGGDLTVGSLRLGTDSDGNGGSAGAGTTVTGTLDFMDGTITANNTGIAGEAVQIGSTNLGPNLTAITGVLNMGDGTTNPTLNYSAGRFEVGTGNGANATFNFRSGTVTGTNQNLIIGQGDAASVSAMTVGGFATAASFATGNADMNWNDGDGTVTIDSNGSISTRSLNFSNNGANTSVLTINTGGSMTVSQNMDERAGSATLNIDGGTMTFTSTTDRIREVDTLNLGQGGTGSNIGTVVGIDPVNALVGGSVGGGTHTINIGGIADTESTTNAGQFNANVQDTYTGGTGNWDTDANWSVGIDPSGAVGVGDQVNVVTSASTLAGAGAATYTTDDLANWTANVRSINGGTDNAIAVTAVNPATIGPMRAIIGGGANVTRDSGDLQIYRGAGASAQQLNVSGGSLTVTSGNDLVIGGTPIAANNNGSFVTQTGGTVTLESDLRFGVAAGDEGGVYNLDGGTLVVQGDIVETDAAVDNAQFFIDGGTLDFQGSNITVQSFRVGDTTGTTGDFTLEAGETLTTTGTFVAGTQGTGTFTAEAGSTLVFGTASGTPFILGDNANGDGTFTSNGATITSSGVVLIADRATGTATLNAGTTWTNTAGDFRVAAGDGVSGQDQGGTGVLNLNGDATIIQSGGNFEVADFGDANLGDNVSRPDGTVNMNGATSRIIVGSNNFILGQQADTIATLNMSGGTIDISTTDGTTPRGAIGDFNVNSGDGTMNMTDGLIIMRNLNLSNNVEGTAILTTSGGKLDVRQDVNYRNNGTDTLALSGDAELEVARDFIINGTASAALNEFSIEGSSVVIDIGDEFRADADAQVSFISDTSNVSLIDAVGVVTLDNATLNLDLSMLATKPSQIDLISNGGADAVVGTFSGLNEGDTAFTFGGGDFYTISYVGDALGGAGAGGGNDVVLIYVPEPGSALLSLLGLWAFAFRRRR